MGKNNRNELISRISHLLDKIRKYRYTPIIILLILVLLYSYFFSIITIDRHNRFGTNAYDLGILDQQIWHQSKFSNPYNTVRGMHSYGDHFSPITALITPLYWIYDDVRVLLLLQSLLLAAAAIPLYFIAKCYLKNKWTPLAISFAYLIFPGLHWANLEDFHTEAFVPLLIFLLFYFIIKEKKWPYLAVLFLTLLVKEDISASLFLLGIYVYFRHDKKIGVITSVTSLVWFILVIKVFTPFFSGEGYVSMGRILGNLGESPLEALLSPFVKPKVFANALFNWSNAVYIWQLLFPVAFIAILNPSTLIISASLLMSLITPWPYAHSIQYHYVLPIIPFIFVSVIIGLSKFRKRRILLYSLMTLIVISSALGNYHLAPYKTSIKNYEHISEKLARFNVPTESEKDISLMISSIPKNASISSFHTLVTQFTHRDQIYMYPNPFKRHYWGTPNQEYITPVFVDYVLIRKNHSEEHNSVIQALTENDTYYSIDETSEFELFKLR